MTIDIVEAYRGMISEKNKIPDYMDVEFDEDILEKETPEYKLKLGIKKWFQTVLKPSPIADKNTIVEGMRVATKVSPMIEETFFVTDIEKYSQSALRDVDSGTKAVTGEYARNTGTGSGMAYVIAGGYEIPLQDIKWAMSGSEFRTLTDYDKYHRIALECGYYQDVFLTTGKTPSQHQAIEMETGRG